MSWLTELLGWPLFLVFAALYLAAIVLLLAILAGCLWCVGLEAASWLRRRRS